MLAELSRREKAANIKPDPDIDVFMKVRIKLPSIVKYTIDPCTQKVEFIFS